MSYEDDFLKAIIDLPEGMFVRIKETVMGDEDIATGAWTSRVSDGSGDTCGCLLFDGYGKDNDLDEAAADIEENGGDEDYALDLLYDFYGNVWSRSGAQELIHAYDVWALSGFRWSDWSHTKHTERAEKFPRRHDDMLTTLGREQLREVFKNAEEARNEQS